MQNASASFTRVRGRSILESPHTVSCIGSRYSDQFGHFEHTGPEGPPLHAARPYQEALGRIRIIASGYRLYGRRGGSQEFMGAVCYQRSGYPDLGVHISRFEPLSYLLGPLGRRVPAPRLQQRVMRL
jgi:hypothetical protein